MRLSNYSGSHHHVQQGAMPLQEIPLSANPQFFPLACLSCLQLERQLSRRVATVVNIHVYLNTEHPPPEVIVLHE